MHVVIIGIEKERSDKQIVGAFFCLTLSRGERLSLSAPLRATTKHFSIFIPRTRSSAPVFAFLHPELGVLCLFFHFYTQNSEFCAYFFIFGAGVGYDGAIFMFLYASSG